MRAVNDDLSPDQNDNWRDEVAHEVASQDLGALVGEIAQVYGYLLACMDLKVSPGWEGDWFGAIGIGQRDCWARLQRMGWKIPAMPAFEIDPVRHMRGAEPYLRKIAPYVQEGLPH